MLPRPSQARPHVARIHWATRRAIDYECHGISYDSLLDGHLLALCVTLITTDDRAEAVQQETGASVEVTFVDQGHNEMFVSAESEAKDRFRAARQGSPRARRRHRPLSWTDLKVPMGP